MGFFTLLGIISLLILLFVIIIHFKLTFKFESSKCLCCYNKNSIEYDPTSNDDECILCLTKIFKYTGIIGKNGKEFYPAYYLFNLVIKILMEILIIIYSFINNNNNNTNDYNYCNINQLISNKFIFASNKVIKPTILSKIIIYLYLYVIIGDIYFYFQRYSSTSQTLRYLTIPTQWTMFKRFIPFIILISIFYIIQMEFYYTFFVGLPIIILGFNIHFSYSFLKNLLKHYKECSLDGVFLIYILHNILFGTNIYIQLKCT